MRTGRRSGSGAGRSRVFGDLGGDLGNTLLVERFGDEDHLAGPVGFDRVIQSAHAGYTQAIQPVAILEESIEQGWGTLASAAAL